MAQDILDQVYGCLIGGAAGDALGAPVEGWYYTEIREKYGRLTEMRPFNGGYCGGDPGSVTDDSTYRQYICYAIVQKGGRITPDDMAKVWLEKVNVKRLWLNESMTMDRLRIGMNPWDSGKGAPPCGCASMAMAPIGIINAGDPAQAYQDGFNIGFINQDDVNRNAAGTVAAAVAAAFLPDATVESVIAAMFAHSDFQMKRALELTMDLARESGTVDEFAEKFYARMLDWTWPQRGWKKERFFSGNSLEFVPVVPAILHLTNGDVNEGIIEGASFGRDCDTIGSIVGNIAGVLQGASAIREDWKASCEAANAAFFEDLEGDPNANFHSMAVRLVEALQKEQQAAEERAGCLRRILGSPS